VAVRHGSGDAPAVAFTFDDGPGAVTPALLDVLARHGAPATFNVLGERLRGREATVRAAAAAGHEIGAHGWRHEDHRDDPAARAAAVELTAEAVEAATGRRPGVFRPPYGLTSPPLERAVARRGLVTVLWDVDPRDWEEPGAAAIRDRVLATIRSGSIVLLHDDRPELAPTVEAVDMLLSALPARGLRPVTISSLFGRQMRGSWAALSATSSDSSKSRSVPNSRSDRIRNAV
jgi:peptidoglycan-N-acetylglucosamine deacetylase